MRFDKSKIIASIFLLVILTLLISDITGFASFKNSIKNADLVALVKVDLIEYEGYFCHIIKDFSKTKYKSNLTPIVWIDNQVDDFDEENINVGDTLFISLINLKEDIINDFGLFVFTQKASERSFQAQQVSNSVLVIENGIVEDYIMKDVSFEQKKNFEKDKMTVEEIENLIIKELQYE